MFESRTLLEFLQSVFGNVSVAQDSQLLLNFLLREIEAVHNVCCFDLLLKNIEKQYTGLRTCVNGGNELNCTSTLFFFG